MITDLRNEFYDNEDELKLACDVYEYYWQKASNENARKIQKTRLSPQQLLMDGVCRFEVINGKSYLICDQGKLYKAMQESPFAKEERWAHDRKLRDERLQKEWDRQLKAGTLVLQSGPNRQHITPEPQIDENGVSRGELVLHRDEKGYVTGYEWKKD